MKNDAFAGFHPAVNFFYFFFVIGFSFTLMHPVALGISLVCAVIYRVYISGFRGFVFFLPIVVSAAVLNPLFTHHGVTILFFLPNGNPVTLESVLFGIAAAVMLGAVLVWFSCFNRVFTGDKIVYLFGRVIPALSLVLSISLRLVPRFKAQIKVISDAQRGIGRDVTNGNLLQKAKHGIKILSIMVTWALENSINTADSMKGRGYGLPGRTVFSIFYITKRDLYGLVFIFVCAALIIWGIVSGDYFFRYFPRIIWGGSWYVFFAYFALGIFPVGVNLKEDLTWKRIESKI